MFRKEFSEVISKTGMVPLKDLRPLLLDKNPAEVSELKLLDFPFFDPIKFAKQVSETSKINYIDISGAKIEDKMLAIIKKTDIIKYRAIPIQRSAKGISFIIYDPSIEDIRKDLQMLVQNTVDFMLSTLDPGKKFIVVLQSPLMKFY